ncbi:MAG TPA: D-alanyl-D-alanine carboxypeptidase/D-alanyl-D-alanine-endopeptidase [Phycisphaerae bacterium]|nr:D-alanyl-D-alanine carboxypeptidase/D-alanyl-D-alanine-endopeptidase [Phycisphaerae bacterium]
MNRRDRYPLLRLARIHSSHRPAALRAVGLLLGLLAFADLGDIRADEPNAATQSRLKARLDAILAIPAGSRARLSAQVLDLDSGQILYESHGGDPVIPASNMKLVMMAAALDMLGTDYKYQTVLAVRDTDLIVVGSGDPTLGDDRFAVERGTSITSVLHEWAAALKKAGVKQIPGNIVIDDSVFDSEFTHPRWPKNQYQAWYEAPVGGLNFAENCVKAMVSPTKAGKKARVQLVPGNTYVKIKNDTATSAKNGVVVSRQAKSDTLHVRGGVAKAGVLDKVTVRDPGLYFGSVLRTILATNGIKVGGDVKREKVRLATGLLPKECHVVHIHRSPLSDALRRCGKDSRGMFAEVLLKTLGAKNGQVGSWDTGRSAAHIFLRKVGAPANQITIDDGSGLSRNNRLSANIATLVLRYIYKSGALPFEMLRNSLATPGTEGTLKKRLREAPLRDRIFAKTGYINNVWTLAGYARTESDQWVAFAIFYNGSGKMPSPKNKIDEAVRVIAKWPNVGSQPATPPKSKTTRTAATDDPEPRS